MYSLIPTTLLIFHPPILQLVSHLSIYHLASLSIVSSLESRVSHLASRVSASHQFALSHVANSVPCLFPTSPPFLAVTFTVTFPDGEGADRARTILPRAVKTSHDRLCTVSRTVEIGTPVTATVEDA